MSDAQDYRGALGLNFFADDALLQALLTRAVESAKRKALFKRLDALGALCGGEYGRLVESAHREENLPRLRSQDRWGARADEILYHPDQIRARRLALESGVLPPTGVVERLVKAYLLNQNGEGGVTCPLAMTDGLVDLLLERGTQQQKERWLPVLEDPHGPTPLTGGQMVTEKQGGSNVSENETVAERDADGTWRLTGTKWFCSNPGELWVTTAKPKGSTHVALFLMARNNPDGSLNEAHILRLKDLAGTRGKATAEIEYRGARAEMIGRPAHGLSILLSSVLKTSRIHVAAASLGMARRALLEARLWSKHRVLLGNPIVVLPNVAHELLVMEAAQTAGMLAFFEMALALERGLPAAQILVPLLKIALSTMGTQMVHRARLLFAGNATLRDFSILPRLAEDALTQEIWEGTHPILAGHALKALKRADAFAGFEAVLNAAVKKKPAKEALPHLERLRESRARLNGELKVLSSASTAEKRRRALPVCRLAYEALVTALLIRDAGSDLEVETPFLKLLAAREF